MTLESLTRDAAGFVVGLRYEDLPEEAVRIARRCILDGLAVQLGGSEQPAIDVMGRYTRSTALLDLLHWGAAERATQPAL